MSEVRSRNWEEITRIMAEARREQSRQFLAVGRWVGRAMVTLSRAAGAAFVNAKRRNTVHHVLSQMTDRELRDIGLSRADIPAVVAGVWTRKPEPGRAKTVAAANANSASASDLRKAA